MDAIYVGCHLCHAQVGEPCRFGLAKGEKYHSRRVRHAQVGQYGKYDIDTEHGLAHGSVCRDSPEGICTQCGQTITRLKAIPALLAAQG